MKNKNIKSLAVVFLALMFTSCVKDLDVTPKDPNIVTSLTVYNTPGAYKEGLAKLYATFSVSGQQGPSGQPDIAGIDEGFGNYLRQYWNLQELSTDEAVIAWNDASIKDFHWQTWAPNDVFIAALYSRIMYTVALSNEFIRATAGNTDPDIMKYHAEARFVRALAYAHAIDLYGNPPFVTEADSPGAFFPKQTTRAALFTYLETELKAIENDLGAPRFEYGRADQAAAWTLLAKLYLNAKVYIGVDKNTECIAYCNKVLAAGYTLTAKYANNFTADNNLSTEMILPITADGQHTQTYGGMVYLIHAQIGGTMDPAKFGVGGGWGGLRTTKALVGKFADTSGATDKRAMFWTDKQKLEINDIGQFTDGWAITKFSNLTSTGAPAPHAHPDFVDTDYPVFRLADVNLMYAEAVLRGGTGGSAATALGLVNANRQRAYGNTSGNITSGQLTLDFILDERSRELYWEGHRRTDLIRFGKFTGSAYLWPWKGKVAAGAATPSFRDLYPIPSNDMGANPTLQQNPGY
ncbi:MAG: RagB/SusD family nutrient uptake outer membrane protein [Bacteroidota bacterium]|nr:RagB/SusD family nutrient uptake outer membrane protein [Bacteroidota bacterium]